MLEQDRVSRKQDQLLKAVDVGAVRNSFTRRTAKVARYMAGDAPNAIGVGQGFAAVGRLLRFGIFIASQDKALALSYLNSLTLMASDLAVHRRGKDIKLGSNYDASSCLGQDVPMWQAIGWIDEASRFAQDIWTTYWDESVARGLSDVLFGIPNPAGWVNDNANPYMSGKQGWLATMTSVDRALWVSKGYDPDGDSMGAHWMLAQVWDDPDPTRVQNALQAMRDHNIGTTFIRDDPEGSRVYVVDEFLLLFDFDVRSINMRRKAIGLEIVPVESYLPQLDLPLTALPFAKDDVFYPAYLRLCEEMGVEPMMHGETVAVRVDPETMGVVRA